MSPLRLLGSTAIAFALSLPALPAFSAMPALTGASPFTLGVDAADALVVEVKQGRSGTGERGRDRDDDDDDDDDHRSGDDNGGGTVSGSGRDKPRIPGGSGCDSPQDVAEHPECQIGGGGGQPIGGDLSGSGRDKPRIPGGSGCDDPQDLIEHPECRL
ncbi:MAG: hypothetical protein KDK10_01330 [Maritimibacter sp.]|nr:hypothetical protein [Maritimibacter sp.]